MDLPKLITESQELSGDQRFPPDATRGYLWFGEVSVTSTIEFGDAGGEITVEPGGHYNPPVAPTGAVTIRSAGTYVIHTTAASFVDVAPL